MEKKKYKWAERLTAAEWLSEQSPIVQQQYNSYIKMMVKKNRDEQPLSDKKIRMLDANEFIALVNDFLEYYNLAQKFDFLAM